MSENICANCRFFVELNSSTANAFNAPYACTRTFDEHFHHSLFPFVRIQPDMTCNHYVNKGTENDKDGFKRD